MLRIWPREVSRWGPCMKAVVRWRRRSYLVRVFDTCLYLARTTKRRSRRRCRMRRRTREDTCLDTALASRSKNGARPGTGGALIGRPGGPENSDFSPFPSLQGNQAQFAPRTSQVVPARLHVVECTTKRRYSTTKSCSSRWRLLSTVSRFSSS